MLLKRFMGESHEAKHTDNTGKHADWVYGEYYSEKLINDSRLHLSIVAIRRKRGSTFRLYREFKRNRHFWMEGPFGPRGEIGFIYLAQTPLNLVKSNFNESSHGIEDSAQEFWEARYPGFRESHSQQAIISIPLQLYHLSHLRWLKNWDLIKQRIFIGLSITTLMGLWILFESGVSTNWDWLFICGFFVLGLTSYSLIYHMSLASRQ